MEQRKCWVQKIAILLCMIIALSSASTVVEVQAAQYSTNGPITGVASLNKYSLLLRVGKSGQLICQGTTGTMKWESSKPSVATVDQNGLVKAKKAGEAIITVSGGNMIGSMQCRVGVSKKISQKAAKAKILSMKSKYKEGMSWTNEKNYYLWEAINCRCYGCIALAGEVSDKVFGKYAPVTTHKNFDKIKIGDHVRIGDSHSVIVIGKSKTAITVLEGNYNASIHWNRKITKTELKKEEFYVDSRY